MESIARKSDGRRIFTPEFKRQQIERVLRGELTLSELSRELQISRPLLASGAETAVAANEDVVPGSELQAAQQRIQELERIIGKQTVDLEILRAARDEAK